MVVKGIPAIAPRFAGLLVNRCTGSRDVPQYGERPLSVLLPHLELDAAHGQVQQVIHRDELLVLKD